MQIKKSIEQRFVLEFMIARHMLKQTTLLHLTTKFNSFFNSFCVLIQDKPLDSIRTWNLQFEFEMKSKTKSQIEI